MVRRTKTVAVSREQASLYLEKAQEFADEAAAAFDQSRFDAALLGAIHAAISACDAVTVALAGIRSSDPDHQRASDLLEQVAGRSEEVRGRARQLRRLLSQKNAVEYEARRTSGPEAVGAIERASRLVAWARDQLREAKLL